MSIGINGAGRIGRCLVRILTSQAYQQRASHPLLAINGMDADTLVHLLKYDSVYGPTSASIEKVEGGSIKINNQTIHISNHRDISLIPWKSLGVKYVLECTGKFNTKSAAQKHIEFGAKKVILSAPSSDHSVEPTVYGVNHLDTVIEKQDQIFSAASCTTNALASLLFVLNNIVDIQYGNCITVHAYTGDQNLTDGAHKDLRRARSATQSIIPTSTGAVKNIDQIFPNLKGKLSISAVRVPVAAVSFIQCNLIVKTPINKEDLLMLAKDFISKQKLHHIVTTTTDPVVSVDMIGNQSSVTIDESLVATNGHQLSIAGWYDNEWGFAQRMVDILKLIIV